MKKLIKKSVKRKFHLYYLLILIFIIIIGIYVYFSLPKEKPVTPQDKTTPSSTQSATINYDKSPVNDSDPQDKSQISVQITNVVISQDNIHIGTMANGTTKGICTLYAINGNVVVSVDSHNIVLNPSGYYSCGVFNFSTNKLNKTGEWTIKLQLTVGSKLVESYAKVNI